MAWVPFEGRLYVVCFTQRGTRLSSSQNPATRRSSKMLRSGYRTFEVHRLTPMYVPP